MSKKPKTVGYIQTPGMMSLKQREALQRALAGGDSDAVVVIPAANFTTIAGTPNRLFGSYINEDGDAV